MGEEPAFDDLPTPPEGDLEVQNLPAIEPEHLPLLASMEEILGYQFQQRELLLKALIHPSMREVAKVSYERLEFLGDAVLGLVVADYLFRRFPQCAEGELTRLKSSVVSRSALARLGRQLNVANHLILGKGMLLQGNTLPRSVVANATEAVIGALYLDGGIERCRAFLIGYLAAPIHHSSRPRHSRNYKSQLQHHTQAQGIGTPSYEVIAMEGPDHERTFSVCAEIGERRFPAATGSSKKVAEQRAARNALRVLGAELDEQD